MYIKAFESRDTARSYTLVTPVLHDASELPFIENEEHVRVVLTESELYNAMDKLFKDKLNEISQRQEGCFAKRNGA